MKRNHFRIVTFFVMLGFLFTGCIFPTYALTPTESTLSLTEQARSQGVVINYSDVFGWAGEREFVLRNCYTGTMVNVTGDPTASNSAVNLATYQSNALWQRWKIEIVPGRGGLVKLVSLASGKCLSIVDPSYEETGLEIVPFDEEQNSFDQDRQLFKLVKNDNDTISLFSYWTYYSMAIGWNGSALVHMEADGSLSQEFQLIAPGAVYNIQNTRSGKSLNPTASGVANGTMISQYDYIPGDDTQQFFVRHVGNGMYTIMEMHSGKLVTAVDVEGLDYREIQLQGDNGAIAQRFRIHYNDDGSISFISVVSSNEKAITILSHHAGQGLANGDIAIEQDFDENNGSQKFVLHKEREAIVAPQEYHIKLSGESNYGITQWGGIYARYESLSNAFYDTWQIVIAPKDGYYIINKSTGEYLTAHDSTVEARVYLSEKGEVDDPDTQIWKFTVCEYGKVRIQSEYHRKQHVTYYLGLLNEGEQYLAQRPFASAEQWVLEQKSPVAYLYSVEDEGHDHISSLIEAKSMLIGRGYDAITIDSRMYPTTCLYDMVDYATIVTTRSHGNVVINPTTGIQEATYILLYDGGIGERLYSHMNYRYNSLYDDYIRSTMVFNGLDLAVFVGCYTGTGGEGANNLPTVLVQQGARTAIGFSASIPCPSANTWTETFYEYLAKGYTVELAAMYADDESEMYLTVICGDRNATLY